MADSFNHDFYITIATVLPLLYIALFLQGDSIQNFTKKVGISYDKVTVDLVAAIFDWFKGRFSIHHTWTMIRAIMRAVFFWSFILVPTIFALLATMVAGPFAIGYSFWALFYQSDTLGLRLAVMLSALGLLVAVSWNPIGVIVNNLMMSHYVEDENSDPETQAGRSDRPERSDQPERPDSSVQDNATGLGWPSPPSSSR